MLLSKQNHKPVFGALLAFMFIFSIFFSFHPQNGAASTFFEGEGEGEGSSGADTERAPTTVLEICENLVDDDGDGLVDNQDAIDCPATTGQAPSLTPGPQVAPEQEEEAAEEELTDEEEEAAALTPTPTPTPEVEEELTDEEEEDALSSDNSLTPAAEICDNTFDDDGDGLTDSEDTEDCPTAETPGEELTDEEEETAALTPTPTPTPTPEVEEELTDEEEEAAALTPTPTPPFVAPFFAPQVTPQATPTPTPTPEAAIEEANVNQEIDQIAQQVAEQTDTSSGTVQQVINQIAVQIANAGGNVNQAIIQISQQVSANPSGPLSQSITQLAAQQAEGNTGIVNQAINQIAQQAAQGGNVTQVINQQATQVAIGEGTVNQQITQVAQQIAQQTGTSPTTVQQTIQQIAIQIVNIGGTSTNVNQAINLIAQQIASNPSGSVSQSITQLAQQTASGNNQCANQAISQIAQQTAGGNNIVQVINQFAIQASCPPTPGPSPNTATLIVVKNVINDNGGTLEPSDFRISITGPAPNPPITSPFSAQDTPGTTIPVNADSPYQVTEITREGYTVDYSAECNSNSGIPEQQTRTCIITNNDESATLRVIKRVINDDGGTLRPSNFQISVTGPSELSPSPASFPGRSSTGTDVVITANTPYRVAETTSSRYDSDFDECRSSRGIHPGETRTCIITNNDKEITDTNTNSIVEYRETTPIAIDIEAVKFDKGTFERSEIIPIADVGPYVMIGGHVLLNLPTGDIKLIAAETSNNGVEHAILLNPQRIGSIRTGQTLYHVDLDDRMSGKNPFTNKADKVTEWTDLWLYNSNQAKDIQVGDDNGWTATLVMAEFPGAKLRCPCEWSDSEIIKQGKSFFSAYGMRALADARPFHVIDGHIALDLPREPSRQQSSVKVVALELDNNNKVMHAVVLNPIKIGDLNSAESLYHVNLAEEMSGKNPFTNRADKVTEWNDLLLWNSDRKNGLAMVEDNQVSVTIVADR